MISEFVREQKRYTQKDLCRILEYFEEKAIPLIRKLKEFGVLKAVRASDIQRDMSDLLDEDTRYVYFTSYTAKLWLVHVYWAKLSC